MTIILSHSIRILLFFNYCCSNTSNNRKHTVQVQMALICGSIWRHHFKIMKLNVSPNWKYEIWRLVVGSWSSKQPKTSVQISLSNLSAQNRIKPLSLSLSLYLQLDKGTEIWKSSGDKASRDRRIVISKNAKF